MTYEPKILKEKLLSAGVHDTMFAANYPIRTSISKVFQGYIDHEYFFDKPRSLVLKAQGTLPLPSDALNALTRFLVEAELNCHYITVRQLIRNLNNEPHFGDELDPRDLLSRDILIIDYMLEADVWSAIARIDQITLLDFCQTYLQGGGVIITRTDTVGPSLEDGAGSYLSAILRTHATMIEV